MQWFNFICKNNYLHDIVRPGNWCRYPGPSKQCLTHGAPQHLMVVPRRSVTRVLGDA
jgi:hypothetical protein